MTTNFEYGSQFTVTDRPGLEAYLCSLWTEYKELWPKSSFENVFNRKYQPFLTFDGILAKPNNFVGFINFKNEAIEIYPRIFQDTVPLEKTLMHSHLLYWLQYVTRLKFPFTKAPLDNTEIERLPELIMYLVAKQINDVVKQQPYSSYELVAEALRAPRGRINFNRYSDRISYGVYHLIDCDHHPFIFDNVLNRVIKYCTRLLLSKTSVTDTQNILNETLFLLDEVEDEPCTVQQLTAIRITPLFQPYEQVIQCCKLVLENQVYSHNEYQLDNWSLLIPMEVVFEDFITEFIKAHFSKDFIIEPQKSDLYLHESPDTFNIQHDILLTHRQTMESIIVDTKYKPRWGDLINDRKKGVAQADMYQMISYAFKRGTNKVLLLYPNTTDNLPNDHVFEVNTPSTDRTIRIKVADVPFWSSQDSRLIERSLQQKLFSLFNGPL